MKGDKRRNEAPELRRDYEEKLNRREARAEYDHFIDLSQEKLPHAVSSLAEKFAGMSRAFDAGVLGKTFQYVYKDECEFKGFQEKRIPDYVSDTHWDGWLAMPDDLRGKKKKQWHSRQYKAYKLWNSKAEERGEGKGSFSLIGENKANTLEEIEEASVEFKARASLAREADTLSREINSASTSEKRIPDLATLNKVKEHMLAIMTIIGPTEK